MPQKTKLLVSRIVALLVLAAFVYGAFVAVRAVFNVVTSLDSEIAVAIIAAAATGFVSVISIVLSKLYESRTLLQREHREKKIPVYEELIKFMSRMFIGAKTGNQPTEKELLQFMSDFTQRVMIWGSDNVLAVWVKWRRSSTGEGASKANPKKLMIIYEDLIFAIRKDLGHKNKGLTETDILALFINDIDKLQNK